MSSPPVGPDEVTPSSSLAIKSPADSTRMAAPRPNPPMSRPLIVLPAEPATSTSPSAPPLEAPVHLDHRRAERVVGLGRAVDRDRDGNTPVVPTPARSTNGPVPGISNVM